MAATDSDIISANLIFNLANNEALYVGPEASLIHTGTASVALLHVTNTVTIAGHIAAPIAVALVTASVASGLGSGQQTIRVMEGGSVYAGRAAISIEQGASTLFNAGDIESNDFGMVTSQGGNAVHNAGTMACRLAALRLSGSGANLVDNAGLMASGGTETVYLWGGGNVLLNSGTIENLNPAALAAVRFGAGGEVNQLTNTGLIEAGAPAATAVLGNTGREEVVNAGRIAGRVDLGLGDDLYDGAAGVTLGRVLGGVGQDLLIGGAGGDTLDGGAGLDTLLGGGGNDLLIGGTSDDEIDGGAGHDTATGGIGADTLEGGEGTDLLSYALGGTIGVQVDLATGDAFLGFAAGDVISGFENLQGGGGGDTLGAAEGGSRLWGLGGDDLLLGAGGADRLLGDAGADTLVGGGGADMLAGGEGLDRFVFLAAAESTGGARDRLLDFADGELIDFSAIDADPTQAGDQAFALIGSAAFGGVAGQLRVVGFGNGVLVQADVNGDKLADLVVMVAGHASLAAADLVL